jgi:hypothetical protein
MPAAKKTTKIENPHPLFPDAERAVVGSISITRNGRRHSVIPHANFDNETELREYCAKIGVGEYICQPQHFETNRYEPGKVQFVIEATLEDDNVVMRAMREEYQLLERTRSELTDMRKFLEDERAALESRRLEIEEKALEARQDLHKSMREASSISASELNTGMQSLLAAQREERDSVRAMESQIRRDFEARDNERRKEHDDAMRQFALDRERIESQAAARAETEIARMRTDHAEELARIRADLKQTYDDRFTHEQRMLGLEFAQKESELRATYALDSRDDLPEEIKHDYLARLLEKQMPSSGPLDSLFDKYGRPLLELVAQAKAAGLIQPLEDGEDNPAAVPGSVPGLAGYPPPAALGSQAQSFADQTPGEIDGVPSDDGPPYIPASMRWGAPPEPEPDVPLNGSGETDDGENFSG